MILLRTVSLLTPDLHPRTGNKLASRSDIQATSDSVGYTSSHKIQKGKREAADLLSPSCILDFAVLNTAHVHQPHITTDRFTPTTTAFQITG